MKYQKYHKFQINMNYIQLISSPLKYVFSLRLLEISKYHNFVTANIYYYSNKKLYIVSLCTYVHGVKYMKTKNN